MATREKIKKKKGKAPGPGPKAGVAPAPSGGGSKSGSVISVREAQDEDRADTVQVFIELHLAKTHLRDLTFIIGGRGMGHNVRKLENFS